MMNQTRYMGTDVPKPGTDVPDPLFPPVDITAANVLERGRLKMLYICYRLQVDSVCARR